MMCGLFVQLGHCDFVKFFQYVGLVWKTILASSLRSRTGCKFGDSENPLLVSVRSGARARMPGMMDTVLNVGFNAKTVEELL